jgi:Large ribosomal RNA subunit accumulation protein YceD
VSLTNEFSRRLVVEPWPDEGMTVDVSADAAERRSLAERFDLLQVRALRGHGRLERRGAELVLRGWLEADVVQECVVSLEPLPARIRQPVERRYRLGGTGDAARARFEPHGTFVLDDDEAEVEPVIGRAIDLGEAFAEELGLALEPYPRAPGASALESGDLGPHVSVGAEDRPGKPFAGLRHLQEKHAR